MSRVRRWWRATPRPVAAAVALFTLAGCRMQHVPSGTPEDAVPRGPFAGMLLVRLRNGANDVDLDGDGGLDLVFSAWRDNGDVHSYTTTTFYWQKRDSVPGPRWQLVPFFDAKRSPKLDAIVTSSGGCALEDLRLLRPGMTGGKNSVVITAERDAARSPNDSTAVTFTIYTLARADNSGTGIPPRRFQLTQTFRTHDRYCDAGDAFTRELDIPADTIGE